MTDLTRVTTVASVLKAVGQIKLPPDVLSAVDAFVSKGEPPAVLLQHLTALAEGGLGKHPLGKGTNVS